MTATMKMRDIQEATGLSRRTLYKNYVKSGMIPKVGKEYDAEKANEVIQQINEKKNTVAPTKSGVSKDKLTLLEEWGIISKLENGRYTRHDIDLAKKLSIHHDRHGNTVLIQARPRAKAKEEASTTMTLNEMFKESGMTKSTLLHYIRQGKIEQAGENAYTTQSFRDFLRGYENLKANSYTKQEVIDKLGITNEEYLDLLKKHKLEKASFERYTKRSVHRLARISRKNWDEKAPEYQNAVPKKAYTNRDVPDDELMTFKEVAARLNRGKSTIVHLVKEGKLELVKKNGYAKESVENYLKTREAKANAKAKAEPEPASEETYTAKEVRQLLGVKNQTAIVYYVNNGRITKTGHNQYTKESVDALVEQRAAKPRRKRAAVEHVLTPEATAQAETETEESTVQA